METAGSPFQEQVTLCKVEIPTYSKNYMLFQIYLAMNHTFNIWTSALNDYLLSSPVVSTLLLFQLSSVSEHSLEHLLVQDRYKFSPRI